MAGSSDLEFWFKLFSACLAFLMSVGTESTWDWPEADQSTRIKRCSCFPHFKRKKKNHKHLTVDITSTKDRSLLNLVFLAGVGSPNDLARIGENLIGHLNSCMVTSKNHAFSSVGAMVKINWF